VYRIAPVGAAMKMVSCGGTLYSHRTMSGPAAALCISIVAMSCSSRDASPPPPAPVAPRDAVVDVGPAAGQFAAWLAVFNTGNREELAAFRDKHLARDLADWPDTDGILQFRAQTGGFDVKRVEESTPSRYTVLMKERASDQVARAAVEVDPAPPHVIRKFDLRAIPPPEGLGPVRMTEADALAALRAELDKAAAEDRFSGAVAIAKNGAPIFREARGLADREAKIATTLDTRFRIGSMNKMFTAVAALQLVQAGKLALDKPIGKVLADYPNKQLASTVTLHHLLTHTGGTGDIFGPDFTAHRLELKALQDYVKLYGKRDLDFAPGARWEYSNYGFVLAGVVIERVTGKTYYDQVEASVFAPAGMRSTASPIENGGKPGRSVAYTRARPGAPWTSAANTLPVRATSAGGGDSTVMDLVRFADALVKHRLLDAAHTELLTTGKIDTPGGHKYAYGFNDDTGGGVRCFGHGGGAPGMNGELVICDSGYTIAVLANLDPPAASQLAEFIKARLPAK
jgi:D-alanyl-D-alanine carboxypeptidase